MTNPGTEDLKQVVVTDTTSGSGTVESMACTFPGENAPTAGVYDAKAKKWTVKWAASFGQSPQDAGHRPILFVHGQTHRRH